MSSERRALFALSYARGFSFLEVIESKTSGNKYVNAVLEDLPIALWRMWDPVGSSTAQEFFANHRDKKAAVNGGVVFGGGDTSPTADNATVASFNGTTGYLSVPAAFHDFGSAGKSFTVEFFIKGGFGESNSGFIRKGNAPFTSGGAGWEVRHQGTGTFEFTRSGSAGSTPTILTSSAPFSTLLWNHVAVTYNASNGEAKFFLNGALVGTETLDNTDNYTDTYNLEIGKGSDGNSSVEMADVAIYDSVLSEARITLHYSQIALQPFYSVLISGIENAHLIDWPTLRVDQQLGSRKVCSFTLIDPEDRMIPLIGQSVIVTLLDGITRIFLGTIDDILLSDVVIDGSTQLMVQVNCVSVEAVLDRHLATAVYETELSGDIVKDLLTMLDEDDAFNRDNIVDGPEITYAVFPYIYIVEALADLLNLTGYASWIDDYGRFYFKPRQADISQFILDDLSSETATYWPIHGFRLKKSRQNYRNTQFLRAGVALTDPRTESFKGDDTLKTFSVSFPVGKEPTITVNGSGQTVGIRGVETGFQWYWNKNTNEISQDDAATPLSAIQTLAVTYQGLYPLQIQVREDTEISARKAIESGSGIYEAIAHDPSVDNFDLANNLAAGLLARFSQIKDFSTFYSFQPGWKVGQLIPTRASRFGIPTFEDFLINSLTIVAIDQWPGLRFEIQALSGEAVGGWVDFFKSLTFSSKDFVIREDEVLILVRQQIDAINLTDVFDTPIQAAAETRIGHMVIGYSQIG